MKTEAVAPKPPADASGNARPAKRDTKDAPADLFSLLLSAAEGDNPLQIATSPDSQDTPLDTQALLNPPVPSPEVGEEAELKDSETVFALPLMASDQKMGETPEAKPDTKPENSRPGAADMGGPGQWVSTVAKARPRAAPPTLLADMAQNLPGPDVTQGLAADPMRSAWHAGSTGQPGGLLAERLGEPDAMDLHALNPAGAERSGEQREGGQGQGQRGEGARVMLESAGQVRSAATDGATIRSFATALGDAMGGGMDQAFEQLGNQISLWAAGQTRKASLMLQAGLREAMEVDVSLVGDKAELAFRTDDVQVREALRAHAHTLLADMLSRAGLGLESLSVGGRDAGESGQPSGDRRDSSARQSDRPAGEPAEAARLLRQQSGVGLSVYA